jgi:hypothetical protein
VNSREHAALGAVVSGLGCLALAESHGPAALATLFVVGVGLSVFVDLDHFPIARLLAGDWSNLRRALADPVRTLSEPSYVFPELRFGQARLASHLLVGATLAGGALLVDPGLAAFLAAVIAAHVLADVLRDRRVL